MGSQNHLHSRSTCWYVPSTCDSTSKFRESYRRAQVDIKYFQFWQCVFWPLHLLVSQISFVPPHYMVHLLNPQPSIRCLVIATVCSQRYESSAIYSYPSSFVFQNVFFTFYLIQYNLLLFSVLLFSVDRVPWHVTVSNCVIIFFLAILSLFTWKTIIVTCKL
jgi:hypothetical protein